MKNELLNEFEAKVMEQRFINRQSIIQIAMNLKTTQYYVDKAIMTATTKLFKEHIKWKL